MKATHLQTEYLTEPLGLGIINPRFYWNCEGGIKQTAYRVTALRKDETIWDSGKVQSCSMTHIRYDGMPLASRDRVEWSVSLWDENGSEGERTTSWFEMGLLEQSDWKAKWISGNYTPKRNCRYPIDCFRRIFNIGKPVSKARLYVSACGLYEANLNDQRIGECVLAPGNTDIRKRIQYQVYEIIDLQQGINRLEISLADGWYRGSIGAFGITNVFGRQTKLLCQLEILYCDGKTETIATDEYWEWSNDGPIRFADLKDGEIVDATMHPSFSGKAICSEVRGLPLPCASDNVLPKRFEHFNASLIITPRGTKVLDFGQNLAGFVAFKIKGEKGQMIKLRLGESLDKDGEFMQHNMQEKRPVKEYTRLTEILFVTGMGNIYKGKIQPTPKQEIIFFCSGSQDYYETKFSINGFRYALVETDIDVKPSDYESIAVYSALDQTGDFTCSSTEINRLVANTRWSMKSNYIDVPTDCPTRERLAWTGDAQVFFNTGAYLMNIAPFMRKWLRDLSDGQLKSGKVPSVVPYNGSAMCYNATGSSAGWQDAAILVPYRYYKRYGDEDLLRNSYDVMKKAALFMINNTGLVNKQAARENPYNKYTYEKGMHLGEWLEPKDFQEKISAQSRPRHPEECTAYLHYSMEHLAEVAKVLGKTEDESLFREYADGAMQAYQWLFLKGGAPDTDRQAKLIRPLAFHLCDGDIRKAIGDRLICAVENRAYKIATGFLSTPFVLDTLTNIGRSDLAYAMLENKEYPGWLYEVIQGATTIWETWEGFSGYQGTGSYNHYSPGAVCEWLFTTCAGVRVAGENHFEIAPVPGGSLTFADAKYRSLYGEVTSHWEKMADGVSYQISIPANTTADIQFPDGNQITLGAGKHRWYR